MPPVGKSAQSAFRLLAAAAIAAMASPASAVLVNKYTFNSNNANDSVGGANGTLVDNTGIASYTGGALNLSNNNGAVSGQDFANPATVGAFVDLPNGVFTNAAIGGTFGQVTVETWVTVQQNREWSRIWDFGTSGPGEGLSGDSPNAQYVFLASQVGAGNNRVGASTHSTGDAYAFLPTTGPLSTGVKHHVVVTLDMFDVTGGLNGTARLYVDNVAGPAAPIADGLFLDTMIDNNNWIGRAQWNDQLFDGLIDELRIYDTALSAAQVSTNFTTGPDPAPVPTLVVNRDTGAVSIANQSLGNIQLKGYTISSTGGGLNPAGWTSIDAGNAFDTDGTWTVTGANTNLQIAESVTSGATDGGQLTVPPTVGSSRSIGSPWVETPVQDLTFSYVLGDNTTGTGQVEYTGTAALRSDFNGDELINVTDWTTFKNNAYTSLTGLGAVQGYLKGDLDGDGDNDFQDFRLFKADFIAANGEPAFTALVGAVPEPGTLTLGAAAAALLLGASRRRTQR